MSETPKIDVDTNSPVIEDAGGQVIDLTPREHEEKEVEIPLHELEEKPEYSNELPPGIVGTQEAIISEVPLYVQEHLKQEKEIEDFKARWAKQLAPYLAAVESDPRQRSKAEGIIRKLFEIEQNNLALRNLRAFDDFERKLDDLRLKRQIVEMALASGKDVNLQEWFVNIRQEQALEEEKMRNPNYDREQQTMASREATEGRVRGAGIVTGEDWRDLLHSEALLESQKRQISADHVRALENIVMGNKAAVEKELEGVGGSLQGLVDEILSQIAAKEGQSQVKAAA